MNKLKNQKTNPLDKVAEDIQKLTEEYDEGSMIYDPLSNEFMTEGQHKIRYDNTPKAHKQLQQHLTGNSNQMKKQKEYFKKAKIEEKIKKVNDNQIKNSLNNFLRAYNGKNK